MVGMHQKKRTQMRLVFEQPFDSDGSQPCRACYRQNTRGPHSGIRRGCIELEIRGAQSMRNFDDDSHIRAVLHQLFRPGDTG